MIKELMWDSSLLKKKIGRLAGIPTEKRRLESAIGKPEQKGFSYITCRLSSQEVSYTHLWSQ